MKTEALIDALARGPVAADADASRLRQIALVAAGVAIAAAAMAVALGPRHDLVAAASQSIFWIKLAFPLLIALAAFAAVSRLGRPGASAAPAWAAAAAVLLLLEAAAIGSLLAVPEGRRAAEVAGRTALPCVLGIVVLSVPILLATLAALRGMAPTRPRAAGLAAGVCAGGFAATVYALHCDESTLAFLGAWYALGIAIPGLLTAWAGPRLLRWA